MKTATLLLAVFSIAAISPLSSGVVVRFEEHPNNHSKRAEIPVSLHQPCQNGSGKLACGDAYEICESGKCVCMPSVSVFDTELEICLIKVNQICGLGSFSYQSCVKHAHCSPFKGSQNQYCACDLDFEATEDGFCVHYWNEPCIDNNDCEGGLKCSDSNCKCPFPDQIFDHAEKKCKGIYQGMCKDDVWDSCVGDLVCEDMKSGEFKCVCPKPFSITLSGDKCALGFGQKCSTNETMNSCDYSRFLDCVKSDNGDGEVGSCKCKSEFLEYSEKNEQCLGKEGAHCNLTESSKPTCIPGTFCTPPVNVDGAKIGFCKEGALYGAAIAIAILSIILAVTCLFGVVSYNFFSRFARLWFGR